MLDACLRSDNRTAFEVDNALALRPVLGNYGIFRIAGEESDRTGTVGCHASHQWIGRIEYGDAGTWCNVLHDDSFNSGQILHRINIRETKVITHAYVGHHRHLAMIEAQSLAQQAATRGLKYRSIDIRVEKNLFCTLWAAAIARIDTLTVNIDAIGAGHTDTQPLAIEDTGDQTNAGCLAVGT